MVKILGTLSGGIVTSAILMACELYNGSFSVGDTVNKIGEVAISSAASYGSVCGLTALVGTYGVAGTGTAISTLSGAAATNATLACIGGFVGSNTVLAGSMVLTGFGIVATIMISSAIWYARNYMSEQTSIRKDLLMLEYLRDNIERSY